MVYVYSDYPIEEVEDYSPTQPHPSVSKQKLKRRSTNRQPIESVVWVEEQEQDERYHDTFPYYEPFIDNDYIQEYPYEVFYPSPYPPPPPFLPPTYSLPLPPPHPIPISSWQYEDQPPLDYYIDDDDDDDYYYYDHHDDHHHYHPNNNNKHIQHELEMLKEEKEFLGRMNNKNKKRFSRVVHKNIINEPMMPMPFMPPSQQLASSSFVTQPPLIRRRRSQPILKKKNHPSTLKKTHHMYHSNNYKNDNDNDMNVNDIFYSYDNENDIILQHHSTSTPSSPLLPHQRKRSSSFSHSLPSHVINHTTHHPSFPPPPPPPSIINSNHHQQQHHPTYHPSSSIDQQQLLLSSNSSTSMLHQPSDIQNKHNTSLFGQSVNNNHNNHNIIPIPQPMMPSTNFFPMPLVPPLPPPSHPSMNFPTLPNFLPSPHLNSFQQQQQQHFSPMILPQQTLKTTLSSSSLPTSPNLSTLSLTSPSLSSSSATATTLLLNKPSSLSSITSSSHPHQNNNNNQKKKESNNEKEEKNENKTPKEDLDISSPHSIASDSKLKSNPNNGLLPLSRSLSLGTSQSLLEKKKSLKRRGSLFESLFQLSTSSTSTLKKENSKQQQQQKEEGKQFVPVHELTTNSLTRKQSLKLEKKMKELAKREYIWCYQINQKASTYFLYNHGKMILNGDGKGNHPWFAMTYKNQLKLDPYIMLYQPHENINVEGLRRPELLPRLIHLDKEPKLTGSITAMPHSKMARVYPSIFNANNYIEIIIACLPVDSQFVVQQN